MLYTILFLLIGLKLKMNTVYFALLSIIAVAQCVRLGVDIAKKLK